MNNVKIKRTLPNKIKSIQLLDSNLSGMFVTHAIIQGSIFILLIILFGFTENMQIFSIVTSSMMVILITQIITFILYKLGRIEFQMKKGNDNNDFFAGWVLSPVGVITQILLSSIFNVILFRSESLPGWETQFDVGFTNIIGIIIGLILGAYYVYFFFFRKTDYSTKDYFEKMSEYKNLFPNNQLYEIIQKTEEYFDYGVDYGVDYEEDYSREIIPFGNDLENQKFFNEINDENIVDNSNKEEIVDVKIKNYKNGKTVRQKR